MINIYLLASVVICFLQQRKRTQALGICYNVFDLFEKPQKGLPLPLVITTFVKYGYRPLVPYVLAVCRS